MQKACEAMLSHNNPVHILRIEVGRTTKLEFEKTFSVDEATSVEFKKISDARNEVVVASNAQYAESAISGVKKYLPCLFGLMDAIDKLPPEFSKWLKIVWTSSLSEGYYSQNAVTHFNWYFEVIFVLLNYALLHRKLAIEKMAGLSDENFDQGCQAPAKLLRQAAGILEYAAKEACSKLIVAQDTIPVPEIHGDLLLALSEICQAESQQLFVKKAIRGKKPATVLAKLCAAVSSRFGHAKQFYDSVVKTKSKNTVLASALDQYITLNRDLYQAMALKYQGVNAFATGSPGEGVANLTKARDIVAKLSYKSSKVPFDDDCKLFWAKLLTEKNLIDAIHEEFVKDNDSIFHERVPELGSITIPEGVHLATSIPFEAPEKAQIDIKQQDSVCILL